MPYITERYNPYKRSQSSLFDTLNTHKKKKFLFAKSRPKETFKFKAKPEYVIFKH